MIKNIDKFDREIDKFYNSVVSNLDKRVDVINKKGKKILKKSIKQALISNRHTKKYINKIDNFDYNIKKINSVITGRGINKKLKNATQPYTINAKITERNIGIKGFYTLLVAQHGRKQLKQSDLSSQFSAFGLKLAPGSVKGGNGQNSASFGTFPNNRVSVPRMGPIKAVKPYYKWHNVTEKKIINNIKELVKQLNK